MATSTRWSATLALLSPEIRDFLLEHRKGKFITFEGVEGSGKTTQAHLLGEYLSSLGIPVVVTREPGGTHIGEQVRQTLLASDNKGMTPETEILLYAASRAQHLREKIIPALDNGQWVICDRYSDATIAYQGYGRGLNLDLIAELNRLISLELEPDLTILLDLDVQEGLKRARKRGEAGNLQEGRFEEEEVAFHRRVREGYMELARRYPRRIRTVSAEGSIEEVNKWVIEVMSTLLKS